MLSELEKSKLPNFWKLHFKTVYSMVNWIRVLLKTLDIWKAKTTNGIDLKFLGCSKLYPMGKNFLSLDFLDVPFYFETFTIKVDVNSIFNH